MLLLEHAAWVGPAVLVEFVGPVVFVAPQIVGVEAGWSRKPARRVETLAPEPAYRVLGMRLGPPSNWMDWAGLVRSSLGPSALVSIERCPSCLEMIDPRHLDWRKGCIFYHCSRDGVSLLSVANVVSKLCWKYGLPTTVRQLAFFRKAWDIQWVGMLPPL